LLAATDVLSILTYAVLVIFIFAMAGWWFYRPPRSELRERSAVEQTVRLSRENKGSNNPALSFQLLLATVVLIWTILAFPTLYHKLLEALGSIAVGST